MKTCSYCGANYPDDTPECPVDHTPLSTKPAASATGLPSASGSQRAEFEFIPPSQEERQQDWVTLVRCGTLLSADLVVSRLRAVEITAFIPDESVTQTLGFLNMSGYVRVQVAPKDYDTAKAVLSERAPEA